MSKQMKQNPYAAEFKESAVKLAIESDQPVSRTAEELGVDKNTLLPESASGSQRIAWGR